MATLQTIIDNTRTKLSSEFGWSTANQLSSDLRDDLDDILAGITKYQLRQQHEQAGGFPDSNAEIDAGSMVIVAYHRLADATDERAYTEGNMHTEQLALMSKSWWKANVAGARSWNRPDLSIDVDRQGNVISWGVLVTFHISG